VPALPSPQPQLDLTLSAAVFLHSLGGMPRGITWPPCCGPHRIRYGAAVDVKRADDLYAQGWNLRQIAAELGIQWSAVRHQLRRAGLTIRRSGPPAHTGSTEQILELRDRGLTWNDVAGQIDMTVPGAWMEPLPAGPAAEAGGLGRWQQVLADALDQNLAIVSVPAVADHRGRVRTRAELAAGRRQSRRLGPCPRASRARRRCGAPDAGDRTYSVLAKPNLIIKDIRLRGLAVAGREAAGGNSPHNHAQTAQNL
jgi:hypothetical protein